MAGKVLNLTILLLSFFPSAVAASISCQTIEQVKSQFRAALNQMDPVINDWDRLADEQLAIIILIGVCGAIVVTIQGIDSNQPLDSKPPVASKKRAADSKQEAVDSKPRFRISKWKKNTTIGVGLFTSCLTIVNANAFAADHKTFKRSAAKARYLKGQIELTLGAYQCTPTNQDEATWKAFVGELSNKLSELAKLETDLYSFSASSLIDTVYAAASDQPRWVDKPPTDTLSLYFIGSGTDSSLATAKTLSFNNALRQAAETAGIDSQIKPADLIDFLSKASTVSKTSFSYDKYRNVYSYYTLLQLPKVSLSPSILRSVSQASSLPFFPPSEDALRHSIEAHLPTFLASDAAVNAAGDHIVTTTPQGSAEILDIFNRRKLIDLNFAGEAIAGQFEPNGDYVDIVTTDKRVHVFDARNGRPTTNTPLSSDRGRFTSATFDANVLVTDEPAGPQIAVDLWRLPTPKHMFGARFSPQPISTSTNGYRAVMVARQDRSISIIDLEQAKARIIPKTQPSPFSAGLTPNSEEVCVTDKTKMIRCWFTASLLPSRILTFPYPVSVLAFTPDSTGLVTIAMDGSIHIRRANQDIDSRLFLGPKGDGRIGFSSNGRWLAIENSDEIVLYPMHFEDVETLSQSPK